MAQGAISDKINRHVEAVFALAKREILRRLVSEAELCIEFDQISAAAILAGIELKELLGSHRTTSADRAKLSSR